MILFNRVRRTVHILAFGVLAAIPSVSMAAASYQEMVFDKLSKCVEFQTGTFILTTSQPIGDTSSFDAFTNVTITVGQSSFTAQLGKDCKYRAGATSARLQNVITLPGGGGALATDVQLNWGGGVLTAVVRGIVPLTGSTVGLTILNGAAIGPVNGTVDSSINFTNASVNITLTDSIPVSGSATQKNKKSCGGVSIRKVQLAGNTP